MQQHQIAQPFLSIWIYGLGLRSEKDLETSYETAKIRHVVRMQSLNTSGISGNLFRAIEAMSFETRLRRGLYRNDLFKIQPSQKANSGHLMQKVLLTTLRVCTLQALLAQVQACKGAWRQETASEEAQASCQGKGQSQSKRQSQRC